MSGIELEYASLGEILWKEPLLEEDPQTAKIIRRLEHVKLDKELSRGEFLDICYWKSSRSIRRCERNSSRQVEQIAQKVFSTSSEKRKIELLTSLDGVSIPTASAILTLTNPQEYCVIDIRVWQLLYELKLVTNNPGGQNVTFQHWCRYLQILRHYAKLLEVPVRVIELTLFRFHQRHQIGNLYKK